MFDYKKTIKYMIDRGKRADEIVIFGASQTGIYILHVLKSEGISIRCFCDNNKCLQKGSIEGIKVIAPEQCIGEYPEALYIVASLNFRNEIESQLVKLGVKDINIICYYEGQFSMDYHKNLEKEYYEDAVQDTYYRVFGRFPNLHPPKTYNEKIIWQKLFDEDERMTLLTDKYLVREWIEKKIGKEYLNDLIGCWEEAKDIDFDRLPNQFVFKLNHGCGWNVIVKNKATIDKRQICMQLEEWKKLNFAYYSLEMQYKNIKPRILCEKYLENKDGDLWDYKVFCFHGEPKYIMFLTDRSMGSLKMAFYNTEWEKQPFVYSYPMLTDDIPKPKCLNKLLELSKELSRGFKQVRVDWYVLNNDEIRFGEMTFTSAGGCAVWDPPEYDRILGEMI